MSNEPNIKGQLNRAQFFTSLVAGLALGLATAVTHLQSTASEWAGPYGPVVIALLGSLGFGLKFLNSGNQAEENGE